MRRVTSHICQLPVPVARSGFWLRGWAVMVACIELSKPRLAVFSTASALTAYAVTQPRAGTFGLTLGGVLAAAAGALSFNQWREWRWDARMRRTASRPLPAGRLSPGIALAWSLGMTLLGAWLLGRVSGVAAAISLLIWVLYGMVYTPLKRHTPWATEVGAVPGALPVLLGAAAAGDWTSRPAWALALVLACWQMPHFYAIGWLHREDYRRAGYRLLPVVCDTMTVARRAAIFSAMLMPLALGICLLGWVGVWTATAVAFAGLWHSSAAASWIRAKDGPPAARRLFIAGIVSLPVVLVSCLVESWMRRY